MRRRQFIFFSIAFVFFLPLFYYLFVLPRSDIQSLAAAYLIVENEGMIKVTRERPQRWFSLDSKTKHDLPIVRTIIISEDWAFYQHSGVDVRQIYHSVTDAFHGESLRGASTISQQVVKNIFFNARRSYIRKFHELFYTLYMEAHLTKKQILTLYLNLIELGPGVYGIVEASQYYFTKSPEELTYREAAFLTMLLPSPIKYGQSFRDKKLTDFAQKSIDRLLNKLVVAKYIQQEDLAALKSRLFSWEQGSPAFDLYEEEIEDMDESSN